MGSFFLNSLGFWHYFVWLCGVVATGLMLFINRNALLFHLYLCVGVVTLIAITIQLILNETKRLRARAADLAENNRRIDTFDSGKYMRKDQPRTVQQWVKWWWRRGC